MDPNLETRLKNVIRHAKERYLKNHSAGIAYILDEIHHSGTGSPLLDNSDDYILALRQELKNLGNRNGRAQPPEAGTAPRNDGISPRR